MERYSYHEFVLYDIIKAMSILCVNLTEGIFSLLEKREKKGLALAIALYKEFDGKAIVISSVAEESVKYAGSTNFSIVFHSPITNSMEFQYSNLSPGFSLYKLGYEALVIIGHAPHLSYLSIYSGNNELLPCEFLRGKSSDSFDEVAVKNINDTSLSTGRASDNGVKFASLLCRGKSVFGAGLGYVFSSMNLKGIAFQGFSRKEVFSSDKDSVKFIHKIENSKFARRIRKNGANCFIDDGLRLGWLPVMNLSRRFDPRAYFLNGEGFTEVFGNYPASCQDCFLACGRRQKNNKTLPSWQECMALGSNIGFFNPRVVSNLVQAAYSEGLDVRHLGGILAYVSTLKTSDLEMLSISNHTEKEYSELIHSIGNSRGVGAIFREGLKGLPNSFQSARGQAINYDLRGSFPEALMTSLCLDIALPASLFLPKQQLSPECSAIMAFYELCYSLALLSFGFAPVVTTCLYWSKLPRFVFQSPVLLRYFAKHFAVYNFKGSDLLRAGLEIIEQLDLTFYPIPEYFELNPDSAKDTATVPLARLQVLFYSEKARAERGLKSKSDISSKPSDVISPAVAPDEERGLEGEPGFNK